MLNRIIKISLLAIIPISIIAFGVLEKSDIYSKLFSLSGVELALLDRFVTNYDQPKQLTIRRDNFPDDFDELWAFLQQHSGKKSKDWIPNVISRIAVENGTYVTLPDIGKVVLVPKETPVIAVKFDKKVKNNQDWVLVGTVGEIEQWVKKEKSKIRFMFDLVVSLFSVSLGVFMEFKIIKKPTER